MSVRHKEAFYRCWPDLEVSMDQKTWKPLGPRSNDDGDDDDFDDERWSDQILVHRWGRPHQWPEKVMVARRRLHQYYHMVVNTEYGVAGVQIDAYVNTHLGLKGSARRTTGYGLKPRSGRQKPNWWKAWSKAHEVD